MLASCRRPVLAAAKCPVSGWARRLPATQLCGTDGGTDERAPLTLGSSPACGQQQRGQQRQRWRARPAVARPVHSSFRGGGGGGGSLAARRTSTGSPWAPGHLVPPAGTRRIPEDLCKALCPSDLLPRLRLAASDPGALLLRVLGSSPALAGRSVPGCPDRSSAPCVPGWDSRRACPVPEAAASRLTQQRLLQLSEIALLAKLVTFHQLYNPAPQPGPMAEAGPGQGASALCCRLLDLHPPVHPRK